MPRRTVASAGQSFSKSFSQSVSHLSVHLEAAASDTYPHRPSAALAEAHFEGRCVLRRAVSQVFAEDVIPRSLSTGYAGSGRGGSRAQLRGGAAHAAGRLGGGSHDRQPGDDFQVGSLDSSE